MHNTQPETETTTKQIRGFFAVLSIVLIIVGQTILYTSTIRQDTGIPPAFWLCIVGVILFMAGLVFRPPHFLQVLFGKMSLSGTAAWIAASVVLSLVAAVSMLLFEKKGNINYLPVISLWLASAICYVAAFLKGSVADIHWKEWLKNHRGELIGLGLIILITVAVRFYQLGNIPRVINGDEGRLGLAAESTDIAPLSNPFALWENIGALYLQLINYIFDFLGTTPFSLRLLAAIGGTLAIPALYLFARQLFGKRIAMIAASILAISHTHINFSRTTGADYIHTTWLAPLVLYFLLSGFEKRSAWRAALGGVLLAIYFSVFQTAQALIVIILSYMLVAFLILRPWFKSNGRQTLAFWGGFVAVSIPELFFIFQKPEEFMARYATSGTYQSGWLTQEMVITGQSAIQILAERVVHAFLSLIYYPALDFYGSPVPMLTLISAALFLIGMAISLWRTRSPNYLLLNGYFWGLTLGVGLLAIPPSADSYRMLIALPAAIIMAAVGLDLLLETVGIGWMNKRLGYGVAVVIIMASLLVTNLRTYYAEFAGRCLYADNLAGRFASYLGSYAGSLKPEYTIYLLSNNIYFYGSHASVDFLSGKHKIINVKGPVYTITPAAQEIIVANPERFDELITWANAHPGGEMQNFYDCTTIIMKAYQFP
jgi:hypothetical protein